MKEIKAHRLPLLVAVLFAVGALGVSLWTMGVPTSLRPEALAAWLNGHGPAGPLLLVALMVIAVVVGPVPTLPISAAAGLAFGVVGGTVVAVVGALIGAAAAFWVARLAGQPLARRLAGDHLLFDPGACNRVLFWIVLLTRLIPLFSFALISYAAGLTAISTARFLLASAIGMLPMTVVYTALGQSLHINPVLTVIAGALIIVLMVLAPWYLERRHGYRFRAWLAGVSSDVGRSQ